jgi:hypothetical protein
VRGNRGGTEGEANTSTTTTTAEELAQRVATVFRHVPAATISAAIAAENRASGEHTSAEALQDSVVRKLLWYQSLPDTATAPTVTAAAAAAVAPAERAAPAKAAATVSVTVSGATAPPSPRGRAGSGERAGTGKGVIARLGGVPALTTTGWLAASEIEAYVLALGLVYLRSKYVHHRRKSTMAHAITTDVVAVSACPRPENVVALAQQYRLCATHHPSLDAALCRGVAAAVIASAKLTRT